MVVAAAGGEEVEAFGQCGEFAGVGGFVVGVLGFDAVEPEVRQAGEGVLEVGEVIDELGFVQSIYRLDAR